MKVELKNLCAGMMSGAALLALSSLASADVTAVFDMGGENMSIEYKDDSNVRMRVPGGNYMLLQNDEVYAVTRQDNEWQVFALSTFASMMGAAGGANAFSIEDAMESAAGVELRDTGGTEVIAGIRGTVHEVIETRNDGTERIAAEVVLADHASAAQVYRGMFAIMSAMGGMAGQQGLGDMASAAYGGEDRAVLRANDDFRLVSLDESAIPDNHFVLPAEPMSIPGFGGGSRASASGGSSPVVDSSAAGNWLESMAGEVGEVVSEETRAAADESREEAEQGITDSVRDGIRDGIRGIFDR